MDGRLTLHATAVSVAGRALLILGPSGSGKSALALDLVGRGAGLIADDRTVVDLVDGALIASCPPAIAGLIEARGVGLLRVPAHPPAQVALAADLGQTETERLPAPHGMTILGLAVPLVRRVDSPHFPAALMLLLAGGRAEP